ncbi:hypothetical protein WJX84_002017, partial [Apatococcus fuscideae]
SPGGMKRKELPQRSEDPAEYEEPPDFLGEEPQFGDEHFAPEVEPTSAALASAGADEKESKPQAKPPAPEQDESRAALNTNRRASRRPQAQKRVTLEEAYGSSSEEDGKDLHEPHDDDASSASEMDVKGLDQVPDSDASSDASMASEGESSSPPAKRKAPAGKKGTTVFKRLSPQNS